MEDTAYNRKIVNQVRAINQRYIKDAQMKGQMLKDMPITRNTIGRGADFEGAGVLSGLLGSIGLGKQGGAMHGAGVLSSILGSMGLGKQAGISTGGIATGGRMRGRPRKMAGAMTGEGFLDDLADGALSIGKTALSLAPLIALGKPKRGRSKMSGKGMMGDAFGDIMHMAEGLGRRKKGGEIALNMRDETFATPSASGRRRRGGISTGGISTGGISTGGLSRKLLGARAVGSGYGELEGSGFFDDVLSGMNNVLSTATQTAQLAKLLKGKGKMGGIETGGIATGGRMRGRPRKMGGEMQAAGVLSGLLGSIGLGKKAGISTGGKRGASKWITHVKAYAKKHGMKYNEALKDPKCKASYKKM
jgi:hypothetical protein